MKILLTSTSFQDTPGKHQEALLATGFEIDRIRGPVKEDILIPIISDYDGVICGDDQYSRKVLEKGRSGKLKILSKYGIGLDKIDVIAAKELGIKVTNCPGVNHVTVAEHVFTLILAFFKNLYDEINITRDGRWKRMIGHEIWGKKIGVVGLGRIGKEVIIRASAFGLKLYAYDKYIDKDFATQYSIQICDSLEKLFEVVDIVSLNMNLTEENRHCVNKKMLKNMNNGGLLLINTARGELVDEKAVIYGLEQKILCGYMTDVMEDEPIIKNHPFIKNDKIFITPHIGSRTYQSVERQGLRSVKNLTENI
jgi:D-3-phosphoglycerate dehydrogenase / 2-oxoglutarate reductase